MCTTCGCGDSELVPVELHEKILAGNDRTAAHNREHFEARGILAVNLMGSPGAGKTAVLEATSRAAAGRGWRLAAVSADLATDNDARRLEAAGIPSRAITTGQACHLDAELVHRSLHGFDLGGADVFFIENVGNLVCPAIYDLGQRANVVVLSITEGEDKPLKYPVMFRAADLVLLTKVDLAGVLGVDLDLIEANLARVMPRPRALRLSARSGDGMAAWVSWLAELKQGAGGRAAPRAGHAHDHHGHRHEGGDGHRHPHVHQHEHEHRHGKHHHSHAHGHAHAHDHDHGAGHPHDEAAAHDHGGGEHAHEGAADHRHVHFGERRSPPARAAASKPPPATKRPGSRGKSSAAPKGKARRGAPKRKRARK
jgi:hydrogenase nickel incorporation protein HypB